MNPPERRCCCPSHDPFDCIRIRYHRFDEDNSDEIDPCECACHDEWDEWMNEEIDS